MAQGAFEPLRPRRVCITEQPAVDVAPFSHEPHVREPDRPSSDVPDATATFSNDALSVSQQASAAALGSSCDSSMCVATLRKLAIALAAKACARALHEAIARNPLFVVRFVDDALRAAGFEDSATVRLCAVDASACAYRLRGDVIADATLARGEVIVELAGGSIGASIEERAAGLVRAAADA